MPVRASSRRSPGVSRPRLRSDLAGHRSSVQVRPGVEPLEDRWLLSTIIDLGSLGGTIMQPTAINASGQVVGYGSFTPNSTLAHAFLYSDGVLTDLGTTGDFASSMAYGINDNGKVVGALSVSPAQVGGHAFLYNGQTLIDEGTAPGYTTSRATAINDLGQVAGDATNNGQLIAGLLYSQGTFTNVSVVTPGPYPQHESLNAAGEVAGSAPTIPGPHAFLYADGRTVDLGTLGGPSSYGYGLNASGQVVGSSSVGNTTVGFLWTPDTPNGTTGRMVNLGMLPGDTASQAIGVNDAGQAVGSSILRLGNQMRERAVLFSDGTVTDLNTLIPPDQGWTLIEANAINDNGQIAGFGHLNGDAFPHAFLLTLDSPAATDPALVQVAGAVAALAWPENPGTAPWIPDTGVALASGADASLGAPSASAPGPIFGAALDTLRSTSRADGLEWGNAVDADFLAGDPFGVR